MRQSQLFTKTRREAPKDEVAKNAQLLIRAGYIHKEMAGVYDLLPLGLRTLNSITGIIREEMNALGASEVHLSALQNPEHWKKTDRWDEKKVDNWFKTSLQSGTEVGLGFTHEEPLTSLMKEHISSWRDLPVAAYQFQMKFRNEERAKSGLMRTREFIMKDLYSFSKNEEEHQLFYERVKEAYQRIFTRVGVGKETFLTFASGGTFSKYSHEFQTICAAGEDTIFVDEKSGVAVNKEVDTKEVRHDAGVSESAKEEKAVEVGNIFTLGTRFSEALGLSYKNEEGVDTPVYMGSYGIGPARLMAVIAEVLSDEKGLVWPESVAPFRVHIVDLSNGEEEVKREAEDLYQELERAGVSVLLDDRDARAGEKFADSDLIGIPLRVVVSQKSLAAGKFECVERGGGKVFHLSTSELLARLNHA